MISFKLKLWCESVGISPKILEEPMVKLYLDEGDAVAALRELQKIEVEPEMAKFRLPGEVISLQARMTQLEFLSIAREG